MNKRLKEIRKHFGLTQQELADKLSVNFNSVSQWERGVSNITDRVVNQICTLFNINKEWFVNGTGDMFNKSEDEKYVESFCESNGLSELEKGILMQYIKIPKDEREKLINYFFSSMNKKKKEN